MPAIDCIGPLPLRHYHSPATVAMVAEASSPHRHTSVWVYLSEFGESLQQLRPPLLENPAENAKYRQIEIFVILHRHPRPPTVAMIVLVALATLQHTFGMLWAPLEGSLQHSHPHDSGRHLLTTLAREGRPLAARADLP